MAQNNLKQINGQKKSSPKLNGQEVDGGYGKVPPQAREMEEVVLGAIMLDKSAIDAVLSMLSVDSFYVDHHKTIFQAMIDLQNRNQPIDIMTMRQELTKTGNLEAIGGTYFLTTLTNMVVSSANIKAHARIIHEKFLSREVIRICGELLSEAYEPCTDAFDLLDSAEERICSISRDNVQGDTLTIDKVLKDAIQQIEEHRLHDSNITGIQTGFPSLDRVTRGWQKGDLIYIGARPSVGKTALALKIAVTAGKNKVSVAVKSLEMKAVRLALRMLSFESGIILNKIQTGRLTDEEMKLIYEAAVLLSSKKIFFDDKPTRSLMQFKSWARKMVKTGVRLIVVDYLQLMSGKGNESNREREVANISRELKVLAMELGIPIIALSQLSREVEKRKDKQPMLSDLRESGSIEQDADVILFIWDPEEEDEPGKRKMRVAKQRDGMLLTIDVDFKTEVQQMSEAVHHSINNHPQLPMGGTWRPVKDITESEKGELPQ